MNKHSMFFLSTGNGLKDKKLRQKDRENLLITTEQFPYDLKIEEDRDMSSGDDDRKALSQRIDEVVEERLSKACLCDSSLQAAS